ncbi:MAG: alpha-glucuronidase family glycosyl hydrolase [bacterium]
MKQMLNKNMDIYFDKHKPELNFAAGEIKASLEKKDFSVKEKPVVNLNETEKNVNNRIILGTGDNELLSRIMEKEDYNFDRPDNLDKQGYLVHKVQKNNSFTFWIIGGDITGVMYGGIDFSREIKTKELPEIEEIKNSPYIKNRGIKLNIPLDARTPSYSDGGDAAQNNIEVMWDMNFWKEYLDELSRNKYNIISLWNLHPFPSMVKVDDYPEVALDDVMQADIDWEQFNKEFDLSGVNMVTDEILSNLIVKQEMTIEEKIKFWQEVMEYAAGRGIKFYIITWNIFTWGAEGKYGINNNPENSTTKDYFRKSVKEMFLTYPHLAGIGVTAGENMNNMSASEKEKWLFETYGKGVLDVLKEEPERKIRFIHRHWWSDVDNILDTFRPVVSKKSIEFDLSFKYSRAHMYSAPDPVFADKVFASLPEDKKMWCNLRNDDLYTLRWGDPDYVREYIKNLPAENKSSGFYMGADGYVFGRECVSLNSEKPPQKEIDKNWYRFMLWGDLAYKPELENSHFKKIIGNKFNVKKDLADKIFSAWQSASKIIPLVTKFHWNDWDFQWHVESCCGRDGFHTVEDFIDHPTMEGTDLINIADYCEKFDAINIKEIKQTTPDEVANKLQENAESALKILSSLNEKFSEKENKELQKTIDDIKAMSYLGKYYANKIEGALYWGLQRRQEESKFNYEINYKELSKNSLKIAQICWQTYARIMSSNYKSPLLARVGKIDWEEISEKVEDDLSIIER